MKEDAKSSTYNLPIAIYPATSRLVVSKVENSWITMNMSEL